MQLNSLNKLVRDKIPQIIESNGEKITFRILNDQEYISCLERKLDEEVAEFHEECEEQKKLEELADILEVIYAWCEARGYSTDELLDVYWKKHMERGGFSKKIFLVAKHGRQSDEYSR